MEAVAVSPMDRDEVDERKFCDSARDFDAVGRTSSQAAVSDEKSNECTVKTELIDDSSDNSGAGEDDGGVCDAAESSLQQTDFSSSRALISASRNSHDDTDHVTVSTDMSLSECGDLRSLTCPAVAKMTERSPVKSEAGCDTSFTSEQQASSIIKLPEHPTANIGRKFSLMEKSRRAFAFKAMQLKKKLPHSAPRCSLLSRRARGRPVTHARDSQKMRRPWQLIELQLPAFCPDDTRGRQCQSLPSVTHHTRPSEQLSLEYLQCVRSAAVASQHTHVRTIVGRKRCEPCSLLCLSSQPVGGAADSPESRWRLPELQCLVCRCQYHSWCVGLTPRDLAPSPVSNFLCQDCHNVMERGGNFDDLGAVTSQCGDSGACDSDSDTSQVSEIVTVDGDSVMEEENHQSVSLSDSSVYHELSCGVAPSSLSSATTPHHHKQDDKDDDEFGGHCVFTRSPHHHQADITWPHMSVLPPDSLADGAAYPANTADDGVLMDLFSDGEFYGTPALFRPERPACTTGSAPDHDWQPMRGSARGRGRGRGRGRPPLPRGFTVSHRRVHGSRMSRAARAGIKNTMATPHTAAAGRVQDKMDSSKLEADSRAHSSITPSSRDCSHETRAASGDCVQAPSNTNQPSDQTGISAKKRSWVAN